MASSRCTGTVKQAYLTRCEGVMTEIIVVVSVIVTTVFVVQVMGDYLDL